MTTEKEIPVTVGAAGCCEVCGVSDPNWRVLRRGDAVVSWGCDDDVYTVLHNLQRDWEITELVVTNALKQREWVSIQGTLDAIADHAIGDIGPAANEPGS
jgi:hypothetical protein